MKILSGRSAAIWRSRCPEYVAGPLLSIVRKHLLHPPDLSVFEPYLDPTRMKGGRSKNILHGPNGSFAGSLVLFQNNCDALSGPNVTALLTAHCFPSCVADNFPTTIDSVSGCDPRPALTADKIHYFLPPSFAYEPVPVVMAGFFKRPHPFSSGWQRIIEPPGVRNGQHFIQLRADNGNPAFE